MNIRICPPPFRANSRKSRWTVDRSRASKWHSFFAAHNTAPGCLATLFLRGACADAFAALRMDIRPNSNAPRIFLALWWSPSRILRSPPSAGSGSREVRSSCRRSLGPSFFGFVFSLLLLLFLRMAPRKEERIN